MYSKYTYILLLNFSITIVSVGLDIHSLNVFAFSVSLFVRDAKSSMIFINMDFSEIRQCQFPTTNILQYTVAMRY